MAYGIFRLRELQVGDISSCEIHNARLYEDLGIPVPENIHPEREGNHGFNNYSIDDEHYLPESDRENGEENPNLWKAIKKRIDGVGVKPRKDSNVAIEIVLSASPELWEVYRADSFMSRVREFVAKKFGGNKNIIASYSHFDEANPHVHLIVTPLIKKEVRWKNKHGEGVKEKWCLTARDFTGTKNHLRNLQQDYYEWCRDNFTNYGVNFYRGVLSEEQTKNYTEETSHELGDLRNELAEVRKEHKRLEELLKSSANTLTNREHLMRHQADLKKKSDKIFTKIEDKSSNMEKTVSELQKKTDIRKKSNKGNGWKKGKDFGQGF